MPSFRESRGILVFLLLLGVLAGLTWRLIQQNSDDHRDFDRSQSSESEPVASPPATARNNLVPGEAGGSSAERSSRVAGSSSVIRLHGRTVNSRGEPLDHASICLLSATNRTNTGTSMTWGRTTSDENGAFALPAPDGATTVNVLLSRGPLATLIREVALRSGGVNDLGDVVLRPGAVVRGSVHDERGRGVPNAVVVFAAADGRRAITDSSGAFGPMTIPAGRYVVEAKAPGLFCQPQVPQEFLAGDVISVPIRMVSGLPLIGEVMVAGASPAGVRVSVLPHRGPGAANLLPVVTTTDENGTFRFDALPSGSYTVTAAHPGYIADSQSGIAAGSEGIRLRLRRGAAIRVTVCDSDTEEAVSCQRVNLLRATTSSPRNAGEFVPVVDGVVTEPRDDGQVEVLVADLEPGRYCVEARAQGYAPSRSRIFAWSRNGDPPGEILVWMKRGIEVTVEVRHRQTREPVERATVSCDGSPSARGGDLNVTSVRTDRDGQCRLRLARAGSYWFSASALGFASTPPLAWDVGNDTSKPLTLWLGLGGTIRGVVSEQDGSRYPGASVVATPEDGPPRFAVSDAEGNYRFRLLTPGRYHLAGHVDRPANRPMRTDRLRIELTDDRAPRTTEDAAVLVSTGITVERNLQVKVPTRATLSGSVVHNGLPCPDRIIVAELADTTRLARTDEAAQFELRGLTAAAVDLWLAWDHAIDMYAGRHELDDAASRSVSIALTTQWIQGTVVDQRGQPVAEAEVLVTPSPREGFEVSWRGTVRGTSDASGRFRLGPFPEGPVSLSVQRVGYLDATTDWEVEGSPHEVQITLESGGWTGIRLAPAEGQPAAFYLAGATDDLRWTRRGVEPQRGLYWLRLPPLTGPARLRAVVTKADGTRWVGEAPMTPEHSAEERISIFLNPEPDK